MATIQITITGDKDTADTLKKISDQFQDLTEPLDNCSRKYLTAISSNFNDEGKTFGKPWKPLSSATIAIKTELKKQGKSIEIEKPLVRTGFMRRSFGFDLKGKTQSDIYNAADYALIHQEGGTVMFKGRTRRVPKRVLAEVDEKREQSVAMTFEAWIYRLIQKYKAE